MKLKPIIAVILACVFCLHICTVPSYAMNVANDEIDFESIMIMEVTKDGAPIRSEPTSAGGESNVVLELSRGDYVAVNGSIVNNAHNLWYTTNFGYIYSGNLCEHTHSYDVFELGNDESIQICSCGAYQLPENSVGSLDQMNAFAIPVAGSLVTEEMLAALAGFGVTATTGATVVFPAVAVVAIGGMLIYFAVSSTGAKVEVREVTLSIEKGDAKNFGEFESGKFYPAATFGAKSNGAILVLTKEMSLNGAKQYLNTGSFSFNAENKVNFSSVYTICDDDAERLCKEMVKIGYGYGDSYYANRQCEVNHANGDSTGYFRHYHIYYRYLSGSQIAIISWTPRGENLGHGWSRRIYP